ncbi:galactose ABC transporter substrate-binding protein [Anaerolentibacter hominis]|uniref:galactose ABC transporter substrate-binding protein n=1 Tax=Anaerolentibacter hominis TaxID=3079009 RepID=UPI0031B7FFA7
MKKKTKKILSLLLVLCMMLSLVACAKDDAPVSTDGDKQGTEDKADKTDEGNKADTGKKLKFGVLIRTFSDTYTTTVRTNMEKYMKEAGIDYEIMDANDSQATQNEQLESLLSKGVDCLIVQTVNVSASEGILNSAVEAGIPVVFFNHEPDKLELLEKEDTTVFVGTNSPEAGYMQADLFEQFWGKDGNGFDRNKDGVAQCVVFQGSPESQEALDRSQYCIEGAEDKGYKFEKLADNYLCNWDATLAQEAMTAFLGTHEDEIEVVFCNNDSMAEGVVAALNAIGYNTGKEGDPSVLVFGVDATDAGVQLIDDGKMQGTVKQDGDAMAKTNVELAIRFANGMTKKEAVADYGLTIFDGDNASVRINYAAYTKQ